MKLKSLIYCKNMYHYVSPLNTLMRKEKYPEPELDPDP